MLMAFGLILIQQEWVMASRQCCSQNRDASLASSEKKAWLWFNWVLAVLGSCLLAISLGSRLESTSMRRKHREKPVSFQGKRFRECLCVRKMTGIFHLRGGSQLQWTPRSTRRWGCQSQLYKQEKQGQSCLFVCLFSDLKLWLRSAH